MISDWIKINVFTQIQLKIERKLGDDPALNMEAATKWCLKIGFSKLKNTLQESSCLENF